MINLLSIEEFDWDKGNINKNLEKHAISFQECEQIFFDPNILILPDYLHSQNEIRYHALGKTKNNFLFISFTIRNNKLRVISARKMNKKEKNIYEQK